MALKLYERYPQLWESPSNDYPQGAFKNLSAQGETDGSYLEKDWLNDYSGFFGALLKNAQMTPDGTVDTAQKSQFYDALIKVAKSAVADQGYATTSYVDNKFNEVPKTEIINDWEQASDENVFSAGFVSKRINQDADGNTIIKSGSQTFTFPSEGGEVALKDKVFKASSFSNLQEAVLKSSNSILILDEPQYEVSSVTFKNITVVCNNATIKKTVRSGTAGLVLEDNVNLIGTLNVECIDESTGDERGVMLAGNNINGGVLNIHKPNLGDNIDYGLSKSNTPLSNIHFDIVNVTNFKAGVFLSKLDNCNISTNVKNYNVGTYLIDVKNSVFPDIKAEGLSQKLTGRAGENGLLLESTVSGGFSNCRFENVAVADSGEHAVRLGGMFRISDVHFGKIHTKRSGSSSKIVASTNATGGNGFKSLGTGSYETWHKNITVDTLIVEDCNIDTDVGINNFSGINVGNTINIVIDNLIFTKSDEQEFIAKVGIFYMSVDGLKINNVTSSGSFSYNAIKCEDDGALPIQNVSIKGSMACDGSNIIFMDTNDRLVENIEYDLVLHKGELSIYARGLNYVNCRATLKHYPDNITGTSPPARASSFVLDVVSVRYPNATFSVGAASGSVLNYRDTGELLYRAGNAWKSLI